ncbi:MAG: hypothetical protein ABI901_02315 [Roseiflexaceae bacterium]
MNKPFVPTSALTNVAMASRRPTWLTGLLIAGLAATISALFLSSAAVERRIALGLGGVDPTVAIGFQPGETTLDGRGFRWTDGDSILRLPAQSPGAHLLELTIAAPRPDDAPVPLTIAVNDSVTIALMARGERHYRILAPARWLLSSANDIHIRSSFYIPTTAPGEPPRELGVVVFEAGWRGLSDPGWIIPLQVASLGLLIWLFVLTLAVAGVRGILRLLLCGMLLAILLAMRHADTRFIYRWHALLLTISVCGFCAVLLVLLRRFPPRQERIMRLRLWLSAHGLAFVSYVIIAAAMLFPLLTVFGSQIPGPQGDNFEYVWKLKWFSDSLLGRHVSPVYVPQIYYPSGVELTISEITPANTLLALPLTWLAGPIVSYNTLVLASFILTACFTYLLACRLGAARPAAWVAGLAFAFYLGREYHVIDGHLGFIGTQWLALTLYGWEGVLTRRRAWDALLTGLGLTLTFWTSWHYGTTFPLLLVLYTVLRLDRRGWAKLRDDWPLLIMIAALVVPLVAPYAQPYVEAQLRGDGYAHPYVQLLQNSATLRDYLLPSPFHPLWGNLIAPLYGRVGTEFLVSLGYTVMLLALAGLWISRQRRVAWGLIAVLVIGLIMSFGPELELPNGARLAMPASYLFEHSVPLFGDIRTWSRTSMYVALCAALLASLALSAIGPRHLPFAAGIAGALILLESAVALPISAAVPRPVDAWLRQQPERGAVVQFPRGAGGLSYFYTSFNDKPTVQGSGKYSPALYREERETLYYFPDEKAIRLLQRWGADFIVVNDGPMTRMAQAGASSSRISRL